jgi:nucleoside-diphosphate-sugar epimerase
MTILVTGGGGFVGAWIIRRLLAEGRSVRVLDARDDRRLVREIAGDVEIDWRVGDIVDGETVAAAAEGCEVLIHLAAILTPACAADPVRGAMIDLVGTLHVFEAAKRHGIGRVVYMSSAGVFGPHDGALPWPTTHYGAYKLACEGCARAYAERDGTASVGFRPFIVYGPGREVGLTAGPTLACRAAAQGEAYTISYTGGADMIFVEDVAAAFVAATLAPGIAGAHVFNILGEVASTEGIVDAIRAEVPGAAITAEGPPLPVVSAIAWDPGLARLLPGLPRTGLREGIGRTVSFYRPPRSRDPQATT